MQSIPPASIPSEAGWAAVARALAHSARNWPDMAEKLWEILDDASAKAPGYDFADNHARWERYVREADRCGNPITLGTLFYLAKQHGWADEPRLPDEHLESDAKAAEGNDGRPLSGGTYEANEALRLLNSHFFVADVKGAAQIACVGDDGAFTYMPTRDFSLKIRNIFVRVSDNQGKTKKVSGEKFWLEHRDRQVRKIIFDPKAPAGAAVAGQFNLWRGFAIEPKKGWNKQRRLWKHIRQVICRREKAKLRYLMFWLAWAVQNPDKTPETVIVLKSNLQGTGKSTLSYVMRTIFGSHAHVIADKERLLGRFNANLETACFICAEEMIWAGDRGTADALKSLITGDSLTLEVKNGARWEIPNRLHFIMTTNHDHAIHAGARDRRFFVLDVDPAKAQNSGWFDPLYRDLDDGGRAEFLYFLQNLNLGEWHPRKLPKTAEAMEQQKMSADSVIQWAQACIDNDALVNEYNFDSHKLNSWIPTNALYESYKKHGKNHPVSYNTFGKALTDMFGPPKRPKDGNDRKRGYFVPDANEWQKLLDARLGIKTTRPPELPEQRRRLSGGVRDVADLDSVLK